MSPLTPATRALFDSESTCCVCHDSKREPLQVHHIDGKRTNNVLGNLAALCNRCDKDAHKKGRAGRPLPPDVIRKYRDAWLEEVRRNKDQSGWTDLMGWAAQEGSSATVKRFRSEPFTVSSPWRMSYGVRVARRWRGHFKINLFREGESEPLEEIENIKDYSTAYWNRGGYVIEDTGTFTLTIRANTEWWWVRIEVQQQGSAVGA